MNKINITRGQGPDYIYRLHGRIFTLYLDTTILHKDILERMLMYFKLQLYKGTN